MASEKLHRKNGERGKLWTFDERVKTLEELYNLAASDPNIYTLVQLFSTYGITTTIYYRCIAKQRDSDETISVLVDSIREILEARLVSVGLTPDTRNLNCVKSMFILKTSYGYSDYPSTVENNEEQYVQTHVIPTVKRVADALPSETVCNCKKTNNDVSNSIQTSINDVSNSLQATVKNTIKTVREIKPVKNVE